MIVAKEGERLANDNIEEVMLAVGFGPNDAISSSIYGVSDVRPRTMMTHVLAKLIAHVLYAGSLHDSRLLSYEDAWWQEVRGAATFYLNQMLAQVPGNVYKDLGT